MHCAKVAAQMKKLLLILSMTAACLSAQAAISVGGGGSGVLDFSTTPVVGDFSTAVLNGTGVTFSNTTMLDPVVSTVTAASVVRALPTSATVPPSTFSGGFRHNNGTGLYIQSRPTTDLTNAANVLLATLQNTSGSSISTMTVAYDFGASAALAGDELPGFQVYYSLTGGAGSWTRIDALSSNVVVGVQSAIVNLSSSWADTTLMYLLWVDDNSNGGTDPSYTIDNFSVVPGGVITENVVVTSPTNTATRPLGAPLVVTASATMAGPISGVQFFLDGASIGTDTTLPYSITNAAPALGAHTLRAIATDNTHSVTSAVVNFTVVANNPPTVSFSEPPAGTNVLVGTTVNVGATAADADGAIASVQFYVDNVLRVTDTTVPYTYQYGDSLAGIHTISAVAVDNSGARTTNSTSITVTNVPGVTLVLTNGSNWKYFEGGVDPGVGWETLAFNDSGWSNGFAELGYGDDDVNRVESTVIGFGGVANLKNAAAYFRKTFTVANATSFTGLVVRILRDDHAIVRLNGNIIYNDMTNVLASINYLTYEQPSAPDDGNVYQNTNASNFLVNGPNILAVEVHQNTTNSSDLSFDMMLLGVAPAGTSLHIVQISANQAEVSWPDTTPNTALLYSTTNITPPATWSLAGLPVLQSGGFFRVTVNTTGPQKFYTLRQ